MHFPKRCRSIALSIFTIGLFFGKPVSAQQTTQPIVYMDTVGKVYSASDIHSLREEYFFLKELPLISNFQRNDTSFRVLNLFGMIDSMSFHIAGEDIRNLYIGKPFPWWGFVKHKELDTMSLKGKAVLINIWATNCGPCIAEFPELNRLMRDYEPKGVSFISICENPKDSVAKLLQKHPFSFTHLTDAYSDLRNFYFDIFPTNIFIGRDGLVQSIYLGTPYRRTADGEIRYVLVYDKYAPILDKLLHK